MKKIEQDPVSDNWCLFQLNKHWKPVKGQGWSFNPYPKDKSAKSFCVYRQAKRQTNSSPFLSLWTFRRNFPESQANISPEMKFPLHLGNILTKATAGWSDLSQSWSFTCRWPFAEILGSLGRIYGKTHDNTQTMTGYKSLLKECGINLSVYLLFLILPLQLLQWT